MTIRLTKLSNAEYALRDIREATMGDGTLKGASPAGYYTAPGNPPGRWIGSACRLVGGREGGEATSAQVRGLINERRDPASGRLLGDPRMEAGDQGNAPVAGWDLTATVPKSVSIMWAFADPDTRQAIDRCLDQAARMTIAYLEDEYARTRAGRGGVASVACDGLAGFQFDHWDSRDGDPHPPQAHRHQQPRPPRHGRPVDRARRPARLPIHPGGQRIPRQPRARPHYPRTRLVVGGPAGRGKPHMGDPGRAATTHRRVLQPRRRDQWRSRAPHRP